MRGTGAELACETLERLGARHVFGLPGTQNVDLFDALGRSPLRTVVPVHELGAAFAAIGSARACGRPGVLATIAGPGFTYALTGLAEALLDSTPLVHLAVAPASGPGRRFRLQAIDQDALATPLAKAVLPARRAAEIPEVVAEAYRTALAGEPGPVVVHLDRAALAERGRAAPPDGPPPARPPAPGQVDEAAAMIARARRVALYVGQGAAAAASDVVRLAELLDAPVLATTSGRGIVPEDHPLARALDRPGEGAGAANAELAQCDVVLALGCKLSHNGAMGFALRLPPDRLIHVDASADVLGAEYPAALAVEADAGAFCAALLERGATLGGKSPAAAPPQASAEPDGTRVGGLAAAEFFAALREALPREGRVVADSGYHQYLARRHFRVLAPGGLLVPADFQSMGFALPAAIGAAAATPDRPVVAILGDGGIAMSGPELATAVRERIPLTVVVLADGAYGLIRRQQLARHGREHGVGLHRVDLRRLAETYGARYACADGDPEPVLRAALGGGGVTLVEVSVDDSAPLRRLAARGRAARMLRTLRLR